MCEKLTLHTQEVNGTSILIFVFDQITDNCGGRY